MKRLKELRGDIYIEGKLFLCNAVENEIY